MWDVFRVLGRVKGVFSTRNWDKPGKVTIQRKRRRNGKLRGKTMFISPLGLGFRAVWFPRLGFEAACGNFLHSRSDKAWQGLQRYWVKCVNYHSQLACGV